MNSLTVVALALLACSSVHGAAIDPHHPDWTEITSVEIFQRAVGLSSTRGVGGIISCGSAGEIVDVNFTGCENVPCEAIVGNTYRVEVDFKPAVTHDSLRLEIQILHQGTYHPVFDAEVPDSGVEAGREYKFGYNIRITDAYMGQSRLAYRLFGPGAPDEICFMVLMNIAHP